MTIYKGGCHCGAVTVELETETDPIEIEVPSKAFKRKVKRRVLYYIAKRNVKFKVGTAPAPAPEEKPQEDKPAKVVPVADPDEL